MTDQDATVEAPDVEDPLGPPGTSGPDDALDLSASDAPEEFADDGAAGADPAGAYSHDGSAGEPPSVEQLILDLERTSAERDEYLDLSRRLQSDFENYRKRVAKQQVDDAARAAEGLVEQLLPVLDACDGAIHHGAAEVEPIFAALLGTLEKAGLERIDPTDEGFDPNRHDAVMHEPAADGDDGTVVAAVMRAGYAWKGRVVRPAMVKVRG